jgi:hypothetical protein
MCRASQGKGPGSISGQFMWNFWRKTWDWERVSCEYFGYLVLVTVHNLANSFNHLLPTLLATGSVFINNRLKKEIDSIKTEYRGVMFSTPTLCSGGLRYGCGTHDVPSPFKHFWWYVYRSSENFSNIQRNFPFKCLQFVAHKSIFLTSCK